MLSKRAFHRVIAFRKKKKKNRSSLTCVRECALSGDFLRREDDAHGGFSKGCIDCGLQ